MTDRYEAEDYESCKVLGNLLQRVRMEMLAALDRELTQGRPDLMELTSAQYIILATLGEGRQSAAALCKGFSYNSGAMTRMIDRLEQKGLVRRARCPHDRRLVNLEITEQGAVALPQMKLAAMRVANWFLHGFTRPEARLLERLLSRMLENAQRRD